MGTWERLREDLRRLREETPGALVMYPDPDSERPPDERHSIGFAAWASDIAARLHDKYGSDLELRVGAMAFPSHGLATNPAAWQLDGASADAAGLTIELIAPITVRTGRSSCEAVWVVNHSTDRQRLMTNGQLQSAVTDHAGRAVGRYTGPQHLPGIRFTVEAGERQQVPVLIGTDSPVPELGYAIRPGGWSLVVEIDAPDRLLSAPLPLTVTS